MGRELKRVPLDFDWTLTKIWEGYINPLYTAVKCPTCDGDGYSPEARHLKDLWYGYVPFDPTSTGSAPFTADDNSIVFAWSKRQCERSPDFYGTHYAAIRSNAKRLCRLWNNQWSHHLDKEDIAALLASGRLMDLTHTWTPEEGWKPKFPPYVPSPREVNEWSIQGMGHGSINSGTCIRAKCERLGVPCYCAACEGEGEIWPSPEAKAAYEAWEKIEPPSGNGYQIWETVSEGSPISPVFSTPEDLARHMASTRWGADDGTPYETWLAFISGPGWAPSMIGGPSGLVNGVRGVVDMKMTTA